MGMSQEVKDFTSGFTAGFKMMDDSFYKQALADYYRKGGKRGSGGGALGYAFDDDDDKPGGLLGWLRGGAKDEPKDPIETGSEKLLRAEQRTIEAGRPDHTKQIRQMQRDFKEQHSPKAAAPKAGNVGPKAPINQPPATEQPNPPTVGPNPANPINKISFESDKETAIDEGNSFEPEVEDAGFEVAIPDEVQTWDAATGGLINPTDAPTEPQDEEALLSDEDRDFDFALKMEQAAAPGVDAGLRFLQSRIAAPASAVPDGNPADDAGSAALARNEGAATDEEVNAINEAIDPEGKLPSIALSQARITAVWDKLGEKDPDKAADLIQRLMLYDRRNAQTRGQLAVQAFAEGRNDEGVRLIQDANNNDLPSATLIQKAVYNPETQTVDAVVRDETGKKNVSLPIQQVAAEADNIAKGRSSFERLTENVQKYRSQGAAPGNDQAISNELFRAQLGLQRAMRTNDQKKIGEARQALDVVEDRVIDEAARLGSKQGSALLKRLGINPSREPKAPPRTPQARTPQPTERERAEQAKRQEVTDLQKKYEDRLYNAYSLGQAGIKVDEDGNATEAVPTGPGGRRSEVAAEAQARETQRPTMERMGGQYNVERSGLAYKQAPDLKQYVEQPFNDRTEQIAQEIKGLVTAKSQGKKEPIMTEPEQRQLRREVDRLAQKNNIDHGELVEFLYNAKYNIANREPLKFDSKTGMVQMGRTKVFVDEDMLRDIAKNVGERARRAEGMASEMDAKQIRDYQQNSRRQRDIDETEAAKKQRAQQAVDDRSLPAVGGDTPRERAQSGRRFIETQQRADKLRQALPSYPDPSVRTYTDKDEDIARQRRRWSYPTGK